MNLRKVIQKDALILGMQSREKTDVIDELLNLLVAQNRVTDRKAARKAILEREKKMSTGMHNGLAIPHGKTEGVTSLQAAVGIVPEGLSFDSQDGKPTHIVILSLSPMNRTGPHIQFLAEISRLMNQVDIREEVVNARSVDELYEILTTR